MPFQKKQWVNVPDPLNPPVIPEGQDALARFDEANMNRIEEGIQEAIDKANSHSHFAEDIKSGAVSVEHGGTGRKTITEGSVLVGNGAETMLEKTPEELREHIGAAPKDHTHEVGAHNHSTDNITSGILGVPRGGTGKGSVTSGNYLVGNGTGAMTEKTPAQVLSHIGAAASGHTHTPASIGASPSSHTHTPASIGAAASSHTHTKSQITDFPTSMTPTSHNQPASTITAGTLGGQVKANASSMTSVGTAQVRDIYAGTSDMTAGSSSLATGTIYFVYE